jgi:hypothetical protein
MNLKSEYQIQFYKITVTTDTQTMQKLNVINYFMITFGIWIQLIKSLINSVGSKLNDSWHLKLRFKRKSGKKWTDETFEMAMMQTSEIALERRWCNVITLQVPQKLLAEMVSTAKMKSFNWGKRTSS